MLSRREAPDGYGPPNRFTSGLEDLRRNSLFAKDVHELRPGRAVNRIWELTGSVVDLLDAQIPDHVYFCAARRRKYV